MSLFTWHFHSNTFDIIRKISRRNTWTTIVCFFNLMPISLFLFLRIYSSVAFDGSFFSFAPDCFVCQRHDACARLVGMTLFYYFKRNINMSFELFFLSLISSSVGSFSLTYAHALVKSILKDSRKKKFFRLNASVSSMALGKKKPRDEGGEKK